MRVLLVEDEVELAATIRGGLAAERIAVDVMHTGPDGLLGRGRVPVRRDAARRHRRRSRGTAQTTRFRRWGHDARLRCQDGS
jgi:hypothetical protein